MCRGSRGGVRWWGGGRSGEGEGCRQGYAASYSAKVHSCVPPWGFGSRCGSSAGSPTAHAAKSEPPEAAAADGNSSDSNAAADGIESDLSGGADAPAQDVVRGVICEPAPG